MTQTIAVLIGSLATAIALFYGDLAIIAFFSLRFNMER